MVFEFKVYFSTGYYLKRAQSALNEFIPFLKVFVQKWTKWTWMEFELSSLISLSKLLNVTLTHICWLMRDMHKNWCISFFVALIYLIKWCFLSYAPVYIENSCFSSLLTIIYLVISPEFCYSSLYICGWMQMCISMWMWN